MLSAGLSFIFVFIQFFALAVIGFTGPLLPENPLLLALEFSGLFIGVWAILAMRVGNFHVAPDPLSWSKFVDRGPYRIIRHPMYLALLLATLPLIIAYPSPLRIGAWIMLLLDLVLKIHYEEGLLNNRYSEYSQYQNQTARLIPGIY